MDIAIFNIGTSITEIEDALDVTMQVTLDDKAFMIDATVIESDDSCVGNVAYSVVGWDPAHWCSAPEHFTNEQLSDIADTATACGTKYHLGLVDNT